MKWHLILLCLLGFVLAHTSTGQNTTVLPALPRIPVEPVKDVPVVRERFLSPGDAVVLAHADVLTLGESACYARYLSLGNIPLRRREDMIKVVDFVLNSLNSTEFVYHATPLHDGKLLRLDLHALGISEQAWDKLAENGSGRVPLPDPYFHVTILSKDKEEEWGYWRNSYGHTSNKQVDASYSWVRTEVKKAKGKKEFLHAPWLPLADILSLQSKTHSKSPILLASWFITYAMLSPAYYDFLGIKNEADIKKLARFDEKLAGDRHVFSVVDTREVTLNNRILIRYPTLNLVTGGYIWESLDTDNPTDDGDFTATPVGFKIKAKEIIWSNPIGLQAYALTNDKGELQNVAPSVIARDKESGFVDRDVRNAVNCITCHALGMRPIQKERIRILGGNRGRVGIDLDQAKEKGAYDLAKGLRYDPAPLIVHDQLIYATAMIGVNGLKSDDNAKLFLGFVKSYLDGAITLEGAAAEAGCDAQGLQASLTAPGPDGKPRNLDHTLQALIQDPTVDVWRIQWERQGFAQLMLHLNPITK